MHLHELIIRAARGEADPTEVETLKRWCDESPENEAEYRELVRIVRVALLAEAERETESLPRRGLDIIRIAENHGPVRPVAGRVPRRRARRFPPGVAVAAAAVLVIGLGLAQWWRSASAPAPTTLAEIRTGIQERRTLQLDEGTLIHAGEQSRLEVTRTGNRVDIWLEGRAYLGVARIEGRTMVIRTPAGEVEVLGTRFELSTRADELRVLVVDGRVGVRGTGGRVEVGESELAVVRGGGVEEVVRVADPLALLGWMEQSMVFQNTPLDRVAREIEWHYGIEVELADPSLASRTVTTSFDGQSLDEVMAIVCRVVRAECAMEGEKMVVRPRPDGSDSRGGSSHPPRELRPGTTAEHREGLPRSVRQVVADPRHVVL